MTEAPVTGTAMTGTAMTGTAVSGTGLAEAAARAGLTVLAEARWPDDGVTEPEQLPYFVISSFSPLVAATARRCLSRWYGAAPVPPGEGARVALILASVRGDVTIARTIAQIVDDGERMPPLLFFQSVGNAVLGYIATLWGIGGPMLCTSPVTDPEEDALALAASVLADGDADTALVVRAEPACTADEQDQAHALLVRLPGLSLPRPHLPGPRLPGRGERPGNKSGQARR